MGGTSEAGNRPGGGIGAPIGSPDPLTKYKWWILSVLAILLIVAAAFFLRKGASTTGTSSVNTDQPDVPHAPVPSRSTLRFIPSGLCFIQQFRVAQ